MMRYRFNRNLYSKVALLKAAYNFTDKAYLHLDIDEKYYYVDFEMKNEKESIPENEFENEMLAQAVRHEIFLQTKEIRKLLFARAMATTVVAECEESDEIITDEFSENEVLKDWFSDEES